MTTVTSWNDALALLTIGAALVVGCEDSSSTGQPGAGGTTTGTGGSAGTVQPGGSGGGGTGGGVGAGGSGAGEACEQSPPPSQLPFVYDRPDVGTPVPQSEVEALTDRYLELLADIRYFDFLQERIHGWPESDPQQGYWYATWWSGVTVQKQGGQVSYIHSADGADNNGLRTGPLMEGALYAALLWGDPAHDHLVRRMARGLTSWILAMEQNGATAPTLLTRAAYPPSISSSDGGWNVFIDYSLNRPGIDNSATEYVHIPDNPHWGDIWIKNKRSKDCIGQMARALGQFRGYAGCLTADTDQDLAQMWDHYGQWARQVETDGWTIATYDANLNIYVPPEDLAHFVLAGGAECAGVLALRLMGQGDPGTHACEDGISWPEDIAFFNDTLMKSGNKQMLRAYHEAALSWALDTGHDDVAFALLQGLADRLNRNLDYLDQNAQLADNMHREDLVTLILEAAALGVPLTSREVRYVHQQIDAARTDYLQPGWHDLFHLFDSGTPDGAYPFEPTSGQMRLYDLGLPLGACASRWRNPASRPLLDCARVMQGP